MDSQRNQEQLHPRRWANCPKHPVGASPVCPMGKWLARSCIFPHAPGWVSRIAHSKDSGVRAKKGHSGMGGGHPGMGGNTGMCSPVGLSPRGTLRASLPCFAGANIPSVPGCKRCPG